MKLFASGPHDKVPFEVALARKDVRLFAASLPLGKRVAFQKKTGIRIRWIKLRTKRVNAAVGPAPTLGQPFRALQTRRGPHCDP